MAPFAHADSEFRTLVLSGDTAPGLNAAFTSFGVPLFAGSHYAFEGLTGFSSSTTTPLRRAIFGGTGAEFDALLLDSDEAPGAPGTQFRYTRTGFAPTAFNQLSQSGAIAFTGELIGAGVNSTVSGTLNHRGIWSTTSDLLALEMRSNDPAPALGSDWRFSLPGSVALNASNAIAFWANVNRGSFPATEARTVLFSRDPGLADFDVLFDDRMTIHGLPTTFQQVQVPLDGRQVIDLPPPAFNAEGAALVMVDFANPAYNQFGRAEALVLASPNGAQVVAHTARNNFDVPVPAGNLAPGLAGTVFSDLQRSRLNDLGAVALAAVTTSAPGMVGVSGRGVWAGAPGELQLIAHEGQTVAEGIQIAEAGFLRPLALLQFNNRGEVALQSELTIDGEDPFTYGVLLGSATSLELVARTGAGGVFEGAEFTNFSDVALNNQGQLAFLAERRDIGLAEQFTALMMADNAGLRTVVRSRRPLEVRPGDLRTVSGIDVSDRYLSDSGELAYRLDFDDGSIGLFVAGAVQGTDFFLRNAGAGVVDWLDADWKDSLDLATSAPGSLGTEIVTIENSNVRIIFEAGATTQSIGRLNATGSLELGDVLDEDRAAPSLIINGNGPGDSNIESLKMHGGGLRALDNVLLAGESEWTGGTLSVAQDFAVTNGASLVLGGAVVANGDGLLLNAGPGRLEFRSDAFLNLSAIKLINLGRIETSAGLIEPGEFTTETVRNEGTFVKRADARVAKDVFTVETAFENSGRVEIRGGELSLRTVGFFRSRHSDGAHYALPGTPEAARPTLRFAGPHDMTGKVTIDGGTNGLWILDNATLDLSQAELDADVDAQWLAATVNAGGVVVDEVANGGLFIQRGRELGIDIDPSTLGGIDSRLVGVLDTEGKVTQRDADLILDRATVILKAGNPDSGWFLDGNASVLAGPGEGTFVNLNGLVHKRLGGESLMEAFYIGATASRVMVTGGSLVLAGGGEFAGTSFAIESTADAAGSVRLVGGNGDTQFSVTGEMTVSAAGFGGGVFAIEDGATLRVESDGIVNLNVLGESGVQLAGGTLSGTGTFRNMGAMQWISGNIGVSDLGSSSAMLENSGFLVIAEADADRVLAGVLLNKGGLVRQNGLLTLSGGLVQIERGSDGFAGDWAAGADILVDANGGRFELLSRSLLSVSLNKHVTIAADFVNRGRVFLDESSELRLTGEVAQNALGVLTAGEWVLSGGSQLFLSGSPIEKIGAGARVSLGDASRFEGLALTANDGELVLLDNAALDLTADFANAGKIEIGLGSILAISGRFDNAGEFDSAGGGITAAQLDNRGNMVLRFGSLDVRNLTTNRGEMTLDGADVNGGFIFANAPGATLTLNDAVLTAGTLSLQGTVRGTGVLNGEVHNFGTLAPGASPGTLEINGSLIAEPGSEMVIEFAGLEPGEFDLIEVHGDAVLDGTLKIYFLEGYLPRAGDSLDFLRVDGMLQGAFADILFPELAPGFRFTTQFNAGQFRIVALTDFAAVPTPAPAVLFATCAVLLAMSGRRGRHGRPASRSARGDAN